MVNNKLVDIDGLHRYHENLKGVLNTKQDKIDDLETIRSGAAAGAVAEENAKSYADGLAGNYDAAGSASQALTDAKGYAEGLNTAMDDRVKVLEAIDHEQLASDASSAAVATVLDGAPEKFDTLKEIAQWISDSESAATAADLVNRVKELEDIDHDAYIAADEVLQATLQSNIEAKQDIITDLQTIREGAALGATALQSVPAEYVTETELTGKGYLTADDFSFATDTDIDDLFK